MSGRAPGVAMRGRQEAWNPLEGKSATDLDLADAGTSGPAWSFFQLSALTQPNFVAGSSVPSRQIS